MVAGFQTGTFSSGMMRSLKLNSVGAPHVTADIWPIQPACIFERYSFSEIRRVAAAEAECVATVASKIQTSVWRNFMRRIWRKDGGKGNEISSAQSGCRKHEPKAVDGWKRAAHLRCGSQSGNGN